MSSNTITRDLGDIQDLLNLALLNEEEYSRVLNNYDSIVAIIIKEYHLDLDYETKLGGIEKVAWVQNYLLPQIKNTHIDYLKIKSTIGRENEKLIAWSRLHRMNTKIISLFGS